MIEGPTGGGSAASSRDASLRIAARNAAPGATRDSTVGDGRVETGWGAAQTNRARFPLSIQTGRGIVAALLAPSQVDIPQNEQCGENPDQRVDFANLPGSDFHDGVGDESQA